MDKVPALEHIKDRIIVKVDRQQKNYHTFSDGKTIRLERGYNNLDHAYTQQTLGEVVSGENIPEGAIILFHFNAIHPVNEVFNTGILKGTDMDTDIGVYSIPKAECFLWKEKGEGFTWKPVDGYVLAKRVFRPYEGPFHGINPTEIKDVLYIETGEFKGEIVQVVKAAAFRLIFRNEKGVEETFIRVRHFEGEDHEREEIIAQRHDLTEQLRIGKLLIGLTAQDAKPLNQIE